MRTALLTIAAIAAGSFPAVSAAGGAHLTLAWEADTLTLDAEEVPLSQVLQALSRKTGIEIAWTGALDEPVSAHIAGAGLIQALQELLAGHDYGIAGPPVACVLIVPARRDSAGPTGGKRKAEDAPSKPAIGQLAAGGNAAARAAAFQEKAAEDKDGAIKNLLAEINDPSQTGRLQSLQMLVESAGADQSVTTDALRDAMKDPDPGLQAYAIKSLADSGDPAAIDALRDAFRSADASTRLTMLEQLATSPAGLSLLREATSDADQKVSARAAALLKGQPD